MAQLIESDGTLNIECSISYAIEFCRSHPGWSWERID